MDTLASTLLTTVCRRQPLCGVLAAGGAARQSALVDFRPALATLCCAAVLQCIA